ncbi:Uma2 family endonuclease [Streptomyces panaciradicis]|uniref:Uma2 family endonuclease n=1 Tax=Streptomyces panaciradicis TaxID=1470261 RepID=UPI00201CD486|nr:Uma2 family endonuclease [Streptomyces panaciradicis]MCL6672937.1 Uma2 family endonuclease [Streptomyces panaciradicis]
MTVMAERTSSQMSLDVFERIAAFAEREDETVRLEFIGGRIGVGKVTNGNHGSIIMWLIRQCMRARPDLDLNPTQGLKVEAYRRGRARPDGVLAPVGHFAGQGDWAETDGVLMVLEITSYDSDTHLRDRVEKPRGYAEAGIPVYLLIDRDSLSVLVHSDPDPEDGYRDIHVVKLGGKVALPDPVGIELDTEELKDYLD